MRECPRCERCYDDEVLLCPEDNSNTRYTLPGNSILAARYLLEKRLGRGAMGQVYLARDQNLQTRKVAVKTIRPEVLNAEELQEGEAIARFEREARTAASIRHPNVVDVTDFGKSPEGVFYLVMEYVQGETLYHLLRREGTLSVPRALTLLRQVAAGVEAAHEEGILHRDLKPANIFIMQKRKKDGSLAGDGFIKVGDFGLAKIVAGAAAEADSASGGPSSRGIIGTPEYMAPEQMQPGTKLDVRADIYALGTIAYHMLGGRPPFTGDLAQLIMQKLMNDPPLLSTLRSDIPTEVEQALMHALEREADARPASVADWIEEMERAVSESSVHESEGEARVVILAPTGAEVYVDDERYGNIGRSGRIILTDIAPGRHVLRVARAGERDDERVIEIRSGSSEQIIQAQLRAMPSSNQPTPSRDEAGSRSQVGPTSAHDVVVCMQCGARFASGIRFCGRCGGSNFRPLNPAQGGASIAGPVIGSLSGGSSGVVQPTGGARCPRCSISYPPGTKFCGRCGLSVQGFAPAAIPPRQVELLCVNCRTSYPAGTKFCGRCGGYLKP
jgi:serine/threonine protein kinase/ribosomal protein L40E